MVVTNKEIEQTYLFSKKIEFLLNDSEEFVELREFNMEQAKQFQIVARVKGEEEIDAIAALSKAEEFFPSCLIDSSFVHENGEKLNGKEVYNFLKKSSALFQMIMVNWMQGDDSPFQLLNKTNKK